MFNNEYFEQIDGVLIGGKASNLFACVIMNYIVDKAMEITPLQDRPFAFYKYVDDCFSVFNDEKSVIKFEKILNSMYSNIAFTTEWQSNNRLCFLDVLVDNSGPNLVTSTFRKPTHAGLYTKWSSFVPRTFKMNFINCLLDRCCMICSSYEIICDEFKQINSMLSRNGYPKYVLDKCICEFYNRKFTTKSLLSKKKDRTPKKSFHLFAVFRCFVIAISLRAEVFLPLTHR